MLTLTSSSVGANHPDFHRLCWDIVAIYFTILHAMVESAQQQLLNAETPPDTEQLQGMEHFRPLGER